MALTIFMRFFSVFCVLAIAGARAGSQCNVMDFGAKGDGKTNDTDAIVKAISACKSPNSVLTFPASKTFLTWPLVIDDMTNLTVVIDGTLSAPEDPSDWPNPLPSAFLFVSNGNGITIQGSGAINGNGDQWWDIRRKDPSKHAPMLTTFDRITALNVFGITLMNSPMFHVVLERVTGADLNMLNISAPKDSPNTDGIDPGTSSDSLRIRNTYIRNGDDCIAIKPGVSNVDISNITCINGHGISIGSIGEDGSSGYVYNISVSDSSFTDTENGARVKTWQGGSGVVSNISYVNLTMTNAGNPIYITQFYCPSSQHPKPCTNSSINVNISDITIKNVVGTHSGDVAVGLLCSDSSPCHGVTVENVNLHPASSGDGNEFQCWQTFGHASNNTPTACIQSN